MNIIEVKQLSKSYDNTKVVKEISFNVKAGSVFGFLGPNGAGKTTTLEMIEGLRSPDSGSVVVFGLDLSKELSQIQNRIGVQLQSAVIDDRIRVREVLELFASYYKNRDVNIDELLSLVNLTEKKNAFQKNLSGGQKQRLNLALCLVNDPDILFLDEPTTGLDPQSRRNLWDVITELQKQNKTIVLTTHYMDEAEKLCDEIAIIDDGRIIKEGTPESLINELNADRIIELEYNEIGFSKLSSLKYLNRVESNNDLIQIYTSELTQCIKSLLELDDYLNLDSLHIRKATLEDVFIQLTGRSLRD